MTRNGMTQFKHFTVNDNSSFVRRWEKVSALTANEVAALESELIYLIRPNSPPRSYHNGTICDLLAA